MTKIAVMLVMVLIISSAHAQVFTYSNEEVIAGIQKGEKQERLIESINIDFKAIKTPQETLHELQYKKWHHIDSLQKLRLYFLQQNDSNRDKNIQAVNQKLDSTEKDFNQRMRDIKYWSRINDYNNRFFFPAYYSSQAILFFEEDTIHNRLFQNNLVNYNPLSKKMTFYTEAVNDYVGPVRIGIGFQIKSEGEKDSLLTQDSVMILSKKTDLVSSLQNGGGDLSISCQIPVIKTKDIYTLIQSKFYIYSSTGISLPVLNRASTELLRGC